MFKLAQVGAVIPAGDEGFYKSGGGEGIMVVVGGNTFKSNELGFYNGFASVGGMEERHGGEVGGYWWA